MQGSQSRRQSLHMPHVFSPEGKDMKDSQAHARMAKNKHVSQREDAYVCSEKQVQWFSVERMKEEQAKENTLDLHSH